jgi:hypothetical protein
MPEKILQQLHHVRMTPTVFENSMTIFLPSLGIARFVLELRCEQVLRKGRAASYVSLDIFWPSYSEREAYARYE